MSKKKSSFEFAIIMITGILQKLHEYSDAEQDQEPAAIEITEIDYIPPPSIPLPPPDRPDIHELPDIVYPDPTIPIGITEADF